MADVRVTRLVGWAVERGAVWSDALEVKVGPVRGRGVFCAGTPIKKGELLLKLPHALAVKPLPQIAALVESGVCSRLLGMVLTMAHGLHARSQAYFEDLAASALPGIPSCWSAAERAHLVGTALDATAAAEDSASIFEREVLPMMERLGLELFPTAARTREAFEAALAWVTSRAFRGLVSYEVGHLFPYLAADGPPPREDGPYMLPLADLVNHTSDPSQLTTLLAEVEGGFEMRAMRDLQPGEEVLHTYGTHAADELMRTYGFWDDTPAQVWSAYISREEVVRAVGRAPRPRTKSLAAAAAELSKQDWAPAVFVLRSAGSNGDGELKLPLHLLSSVQVLAFGEEEFSAWVDAGCIPLGEEYFDDDSISTVVACLTEVADCCLQRYPKTTPPAEGVGEHTVAIGGMLRAREQQLFDQLKKTAASVRLRYEEARGEEEEEEDGGEDEEEEDEGHSESAESEDEPPSKRQK